MISASNANIVEAKKLLQKKFRDLTGNFLIEGQKLLREAIDRNAKILYIIVEEGKVDDFSQDLIRANVPYFEVSKKTFASLTDSVTPQGILSVLHKPDITLRCPTNKAIILEQIQDPANVGAILRTAAATGYDDIYLIDCADVYSPKCMRSGMSAQFCLNLFCADSAEVFNIVKQKCTIICADMDGTDIFEANVPQQHALLFGNEGNGVSDFAKAFSDVSVSLPMSNNMESLNVAVCAGVMMYTLFHKTKK